MRLQTEKKLNPTWEQQNKSMGKIKCRARKSLNERDTTKQERKSMTALTQKAKF